MRLRIVLAGLALSLLGVVPRHPADTSLGSVRGTVLDPSGAAIPGAKVYDEPMGTVRIGKDHFTLSDEAGRFFLEDVPVGKTMVIATKTEAGYPDSRYAVYTSDEVLPVVEVQAGHTTGPVVVRLPSKGGVHTGRIIDARSQLPLPGSRITLSRGDHEGWFVETDPEANGSFAFIIPSKPFHMQVSAPGYKSWTYEQSGLSQNHAPLLIGAEVKKEIIVQLRSLN